MPSIKYHTTRIAPLIGGTIMGPVHSTSHEGENCYFGIKIACKDGKERLLWADRDAEGNGPGWFSIQELTHGR